MKRLLVTGAAGNLGGLLRGRLDHLADIVRLSDRTPLGDVRAGEEDMPCDLADADAVREVVAGCEAIVHLGGQSVEAPFDVILNSNLIGLYNLYEAARCAGTRRVVFASSNHVIGYHTVEERLDARAEMRPDSLYGVSKCFGEAVARLYHDKYGIESALVRIGTCVEAPKDHRQLSIWLSPDDFVRLIECVFTVPRLGCPVIYGASANSRSWWDNTHAGYVGWHPRDSADAFAGGIGRTVPRPDRDDPVAVYQGGAFVLASHLADD